MARKKESEWQTEGYPTETGVYKVRTSGETSGFIWCWWNNEKPYHCWDIACETKQEAVEMATDKFCSYLQDWEWKGLLG